MRTVVLSDLHNREFGPEKARLYLEANRGALGKYRELCRGIDCDFEERDACVYALTDRRKLDRELEALERQEAPTRRQEVEARKETATIEKLKEHKLEDYRKAEQKDEEQRIEEFVSTTRAMAAMGI